MGSSWVDSSLKGLTLLGRRAEQRKSFHQSFGRAKPVPGSATDPSGLAQPNPFACSTPRPILLHFGSHLCKRLLLFGWAVGGVSGLGEVQRWAVIYAHGRGSKTSRFYGIPSGLQPISSSCYILSAAFGRALGAGIAVLSCPGLLSALALPSEHEEHEEFGAGAEQDGSLCISPFPWRSPAWLVPWDPNEAFPHWDWM